MIPCNTARQADAEDKRQVAICRLVPEVAPVSLVLYCASYPSIWHFESDTGERGRNREKERRISPVFSWNLLWRECSRPNRFDYANANRSFDSWFSRGFAIPDFVPGASRRDQRSNGFRHRSRCKCPRHFCSFGYLAKAVQLKLLWVKCFKAKEHARFSHKSLRTPRK